MRLTLFPALCVLSMGTLFANAEIVYSGYDHSFSYAGAGDINDPLNQDRITDNVWITRGATRGIFNIAQEPSFQGTGSNSPSPIGTLWALGNTSEYDTLTYVTWVEVHEQFPLGLLNQEVVIYLEDDDIYIDFMLTFWESGGGGGISYVRSSVPGPASGSLLAMGGLGVMRRRRR